MAENDKSTKAPEKQAGSAAKTADKAETPQAKAKEAAPAKADAAKTPVKKTKSAPAKSTTAGKKAAKKKTSAQKKTTAKKTAAANGNSRAGKTARKTADKAAAKTNPQPAQIMENVMTQGKTQFDKLAQDAAASSKEQAEAFIKSSNIFMKGFEDIAKTYTAWAQSAVEKNTQGVKTLMSSKTLNEFTETQNKLAQQNFDDFFAGATKLSELSVKVATDALAPINDQVNKTVKKATDSLAA